MDAEQPTGNDVVNPETPSGDAAMPERKPSKVPPVGPDVKRAIEELRGR